MPWLSRGRKAREELPQQRVGELPDASIATLRGQHQWAVSEWVESLRGGTDGSKSLSELLAAAVLPNNLSGSELSYIRSISRSSSREAVLRKLKQSSLLDHLASMVFAGALKLFQDGTPTTSAELNTKFA